MKIRLEITMQREDGARADVDDVTQAVVEYLDGSDHYGEDDSGRDWCYRVDSVDTIV